jgi:peptidoglycan/LPS O-acetylase OafA/YrhL
VKSSQKAKELLPSIALMRAAAALIVVYDHLVGMWLARSGNTWAPAQWADRWLFDPLRLMMHGGGMAVAVFFLVSGFIILHVAQRETRREFVIKRLLRIFPPLWLSILLLLAVYGTTLTLSGNPGVRGLALEGVLAQPNPWPDILAALTLSNYLLGTPPINGVAWTLIIEMLFYAFVALLLPQLKARPRTAICLAFGLLALLQWQAHSHAVVFLLAVNGVYVSYLFLGSLIWLRWAGRIGNGFFLAGSLAFMGLFLRGVRMIVLQPPYTLADYGISYALAWLIFVAVLLLNNKLHLGTVSAFFSRISYSLYLNHGGLGLLALTLLYPQLGYPAALALTFPLVVAISAASWRWVEAPSQRLARRWARRAPASKCTTQ